MSAGPLQNHRQESRLHLLIHYMDDLRTLIVVAVEVEDRPRVEIVDRAG